MTQASEDHGETEAIGGSRSVVRENSDEFRRKDTEGIASEPVDPTND